jgi:hypothetical protein
MKARHAKSHAKSRQRPLQPQALNLRPCFHFQITRVHTPAHSRPTSFRVQSWIFPCRSMTPFPTFLRRRSNFCRTSPLAAIATKTRTCARQLCFCPIPSRIRDFEFEVRYSLVLLLGNLLPNHFTPSLEDLSNVPVHHSTVLISSNFVPPSDLLDAPLIAPHRQLGLKQDDSFLDPPEDSFVVAIPPRSTPPPGLIHAGSISIPFNVALAPVQTSVSLAVLSISPAVLSYQQLRVMINTDWQEDSLVHKAPPTLALRLHVTPQPSLPSSLPCSAHIDLRFVFVTSHDCGLVLGPRHFKNLSHSCAQGLEQKPRFWQCHHHARQRPHALAPARAAQAACCTTCIRSGRFV